MKPMKAPGATAKQLKELLAQRYQFPEWHVDYEVTLGARRIDAVAFRLWGGGKIGRRVIAFECKVSRGDWLTELSQWDKAHEWAAVADEFYVVTPPGLIKPGELPRSWGHLEVQGSRLRLRAHAPVEVPQPRDIDREIAGRFITRLREARDGRSARELGELQLRLRHELKVELEARYSEELTKLRQLRDEYSELQHAAGYGADPKALLGKAAALVRAWRGVQSAQQWDLSGPLKSMARGVEQAAQHVEEFNKALVEFSAVEEAK